VFVNSALPVMDMDTETRSWEGYSNSVALTPALLIKHFVWLAVSSGCGRHAFRSDANS
jgi:hypothetical protein